MKLQEIKSKENLITYIENMVKNYDILYSNDDFVKEIVILCGHCVELSKQKNITKVIDKSFKEMEESGEMDKINADLELFENYKLNIYNEITRTADILFSRGKDKEAIEYLDRFGIIPDEEILKRYRK